MNPAERLKLLIEGDEDLLTLNTGLCQLTLDRPAATASTPTISASKGPTKASTPEVKLSDIWTASTPWTCWSNDATASSAKKGDSDEDGAFKDEYLASFSRASRMKEKASMNQKSTKAKKLSTSKARAVHAGALGTGTPPTSDSKNESGSFCHLVTISRFPYKFVKGEDSVRIAKEYFDEGKFWDRPWDIYYVYPPAYVTLRPFFLIPKTQAQELIDTINKEFDCKLSLPEDPEIGALIHFTPDGTPQPKFIGTSLNREMKDKMMEAVPSPPSGGGEPGENAPPELKRAFDAYREKMEILYAATRRKPKKGKGKRPLTQAQNIRSWYHELKRTQCYLGLRPRAPRGDQSQTDVATSNNGSSWAEQQLAEKKLALANGATLEPLDVEEPAPFAFADEPVFVSIDVESNEIHHEQITEIGVSTLDTLDLTGVPPGEGGRSWMGKIRSRHFRISEYAGFTNHIFVAGCPDRFEFGYSEFTPIKRSAAAVDTCFQPPYSGHIPYKEFDYRFASNKATGKGEIADGGVQLPDSQHEKGSSRPVKSYKAVPRKVILVGHSLSTDIAYLQRLGCKTFDPQNPSTTLGSHADDRPYFLDNIDTTNIFRVLKQESQQSSLAKVLADLGIEAWSLHNAGNDARYTLEAMIAVAIKALQTDGTDAGDRKPPVVTVQPTQESSDSDLQSRQEAKRRIAAKQKEAETRAREERALWEAAMGWNGDPNSARNDIDGGLPRGLKLTDL